MDNKSWMDVLIDKKSTIFLTHNILITLIFSSIIIFGSLDRNDIAFTASGYIFFVAMGQFLMTMIDNHEMQQSKNKLNRSLDNLQMQLKRNADTDRKNYLELTNELQSTQYELIKLKEELNKYDNQETDN